MPNVTLKRWDGTAWVELLPTPGPHVHAASDITSGIFSTSRLGTGTADSTTFLRGDGTWQSVSAGTVTGTGTANQLTYWVGTNELGSLNTSTYPSLTELSYVKGVTSAIQTQLNGTVKTTGDQTITGNITITEEVKASNIHDWQWKWKRYATLVTPAGSSATQWTDYFRTFFYKPSLATMTTYPLQAEGYLDTRTQVNAEGGFGGSNYGNMFGNLDQYHAHIYTNIYVEYPFSISISNFNGDDPHAIFIDEVFVHGNISCCVDTSYSYTFTPGWHRIDLIYAEGGGGDWIRMGWNPKDFTTSIKEMNPHTGFERSIDGNLTVNGNVGIGTTTPATRLHVFNENNTTPLRVAVGSNAIYDFSANSTSAYTTSFNMTNTGFSIGHTSAIRDFRIQTNSTPRITVLGDGNVGIGTTTPGVKFDVTGDHVSGQGIARFNGTTHAVFTLNSATSYNSNLHFNTNAVPKWYIGNQNADSSDRFEITSRIGSDNVRLSVLQNGNVGIGTTVPGQKLEIADSTLPAIRLTNLDTSMDQNQEIGRLEFYNSDTSGAGPKIEARISALAFGGTGIGGSLVFSTGRSVSSPEGEEPIERLRINGDGNVSIGTTTPSAYGKLTVADGIVTNSLYASDRVVFGDIVGYDVPYIAWNGSSTPYQIRIADPAYEDPIIIDTEAVSITANKFIANSNINIGTSLQGIAAITTTFTSQSVLTSYAVSTYATGKFMIQATSGGNRHISELLVTHNGTVSTATEYGILKTAGNLFTVTTDISGGNVRILVTSASATSTAYRTTFTLIGV